MPTVLIACDDFKGSMSAFEACSAIARAARSIRPDATIDLCPIADGGGGTLDALLSNLGGTRMQSEVSGPRGELRQARWGLLDNATAVIEMAEAAGLTLLAESERDPRKTTTYGVGQLILEALDHKAAHIIVCIGGSATTDAGCAMAQALGAQFFTQDGSVEEKLVGQHLERLTRIDTGGIDQRVSQVRFDVACDVANPLFGPEGAAFQYAAQKCAPDLNIEEIIAGLDRGLANVSTLCPATNPQLAGAGAAGGLGFGLVHFCKATLKTGVSIVLEATDFHARAEKADLIITGEGQWNATSLYGKACYGVAQASQSTKTIALVGQLDTTKEQARLAGIDEIYPIVREGVSVEAALQNPEEELEHLAKEVLGYHLP